MPENRIQRVYGWISGLFDLHALFFAAFLMLPNLKSDDARVEFAILSPSLMKGLVILGAMVLGLQRAVRLKTESHPSVGWSRRPWVWMFGFFLTVSASLFWTEWDEYATEKTEKLLTLTFLSATLPLLLVRRTSDLSKLFNALALGGLVYGVTAVFSFAFSTSQFRMTALGSNPITVGRAVGVSLLWFCMNGLEGRMRPLLSVPLAAATFIMVLGSGSKGPLFSSLLALGLGVGLFYRQKIKGRNVWVAFLLIGLLGGLVAGFVQVLPTVATGRLMTFLGGELGNSEMARIDALERSVEMIQTHPMGIGWGNFDTKIDMWRNGEKLRYPHNIFLELFLEAGWLAGIYFTFICGIAFARAYSAGGWSLENKMLLVLMFYFSCTAMFSGDVNSNRILLAFFAIGLGVKDIRSA